MDETLKKVVEAVGEEIKKLVKKIESHEIAIRVQKERNYDLNNRLDKIQAKKEIDYVKLIDALLNHIVNSKDKQLNDSIEIIKNLITKE